MVTGAMSPVIIRGKTIGVRWRSRSGSMDAGCNI